MLGATGPDSLFGEFWGHNLQPYSLGHLAKCGASSKLLCFFFGGVVELMEKNDCTQPGGGDLCASNS